jgi:predicted nicotinamide N-methyase
MIESSSGRYFGPERTDSFRFGGRAIRVAAPADPDRLLDDPSVLARNAADGYAPYWAQHWPGAFLLAEVVAERSLIAGTRAIEIGCGLGLAGLVALGRELFVHFTDYDDAPFAYIEKSVALSGLDASRMTAERLDWRFPPDIRYPLVLGADLLYETANAPVLAGLIAAILEPGGEALLTTPFRVEIQRLEPIWAERGLSAIPTAVAAKNADGRPIEGTLWTIKLK